MTSRPLGPGALRPADLTGPALDLLVVGGGLAGLTAALEAHAAGARVALVTKTVLGDGSTRWAQGGLAAPVGRADVAAHVADTLAAGGPTVPPAVAAAVVGHGADAVRDLWRRGVRFDTDPDGFWALGLEAAHSRPRILHAGGDRTGAVVAAALAAAVRAAGVPVVEGAFLEELLLDEQGVHGARVSGVDVRARAVLLATGGAGQVWARTTNPAVATGDGLAAAWRAGALLADLEMVQFHPTTAAFGTRSLISEAVRGEGAVLRDESGHRFALDVDPRGELAPRDVVARSIAAVMARQDARPVLLDARGVSARLGRPFAERFPQITADCAAAGLDPERDLLPVTPAAHYLMGGLRTDASGRTSLPGLWAAGEVACTGVHGANRLASNSLLEAAVLAAVAVADLLADPGADRAAVGADDEVLDVVDPAASARRSPLPRAEIQQIAWEHAGLLREGSGLELAGKLLGLDEDPATGPLPADASPAEREDANLLTVARLVVTAARARPHSLGAHHRSDAVPTPAAPRRRSLRRTR
ncbi:L-aspartate oxidase [Kineococcus gynurae]|uniref:L-aspartate oxidase n=1 Tax=Kineococcus gynurae TaxID=452979 RepID=A0ABV5LWG1_9ACTN